MAQSLLRLPAVIERTGYQRSTIYSLIRRGEFPEPITLGPRIVAWDSNEIDAWIQQQIDSGRVEAKQRELKRNSAGRFHPMPEAA